MFFWGEFGKLRGSSRAFLFDRHCRFLFVILKLQPTSERLFLFERLNGRLGQSSLSRLVAPGRSFKLGGCNE